MPKLAVVRAALLGVALTSTMGCRGRPRSWDVPIEGERPRDTGAVILEFDLGSGAPERSAGGFLSLPSHHTFDALVAALRSAEARKNVKGVFVAFDTAGIGWARAHEFGDGLKRIKDSGVPVLCHADAWDNTAYAIAVRGCSTIAMSPAGEVEVTGPSATTPYARELLEDRLHAQVDMLQIGKFKGAAEPLTRDGPSDEFRTSIERALKAITRSYREALDERGVGALLGTGPYMGGEALDNKLVDELVDRKAAREEIKKKGNAVIDVVYGPGTAGQKPGLADILRAISQNDGEASNKPHVELVRLSGEIALDGGGGLFGGGGIVARKVVEQARKLANNDSVRAVVLRIDSPGGSALGSDLAWIAVKELRDKKPVIVSIGEMAASGGYYIACAGTRIFAEPESIVGSIGVVGGKISFEGTLAMVGVHTASFGDKRAAMLGSITEPWDDPTRTRVRAAMTKIYELFLERVSEGRGEPQSTFENAVEGRVFGGEQAKELKLVDDIGGLADAIAAAKKAANLPDTAPVVTDEAGGLFSGLAGGDELHALFPLAGATIAGELVDAEELSALRSWALAFLRATRGGSVAAMLPAPLLVR